MPTQHFRVEQVPGAPPAEQPNWAAISQAEDAHVEAAKNLKDTVDTLDQRSEELAEAKDAVDVNVGLLFETLTRELGMLEGDLSDTRAAIGSIREWLAGSQGLGALKGVLPMNEVGRSARTGPGPRCCRAGRSERRRSIRY